MAPVAPARSGYTVAGKFSAVAQIANTSILVAPVWEFGSGLSRPARVGLVYAGGGSIADYPAPQASVS